MGRKRANLLGVLIILSVWASKLAAQQPAADSVYPFSRLEVIKGSIFGLPNDERTWTPLPAATLFTEGWREPWIAPPAGSGGAPRQGWINVFDGHFNRNGFFIYAFTDGRANGGEMHEGLFFFQSPLSRRLYLTFIVPFVSISRGNFDLTDDEDFGDISIAPGVMIHESENLSVSGHLNIRTPTGEPETGGELTRLFPNLQFWWNVVDGWVMRGGGGLEIPLDEPQGPDGIWINTLGIGKVLTPHEAAPFGDLAIFLATLTRTELGGPGDTFVSLTPGFRTHLGRDFFLLGGLEVPVTGPKSFDQRWIFLFVKGF
ncbi:MAG: hypothetical protein KatS3mg105_2063 [Gemmatales bacterium]|nr:MAG: hypothetical protein KatS3mg105_2063 [Gemmatales bacterium]